MEHLKLFATRLNIPRLIRVCEDLHHWRELVYLYIQYDEYDNAALVQVKPLLCYPWTPLLGPLPVLTGLAPARIWAPLMSVCLHCIHGN